MTYKNLEDKSIYNKSYGKEYYANNKDRMKLHRQKWYQKNKIQVQIKNKEYQNNIRLNVLEHYSAGTPACACCGETQVLFLCLDHINNDGNKLRAIHGTGIKFYNWIINNKYPDHIQVLCHNCNMGKHFNGGVCPHTP